MAEVKPIRQGDVWLIPMTEDEIHEFRSDYTYGYFAQEQRKRGEGIIVAEGEATGHHHRIRSPHARTYRRKREVRGLQNRVLHSPKGGSTITHEEHAALEIPEGMYKVVIAREYTPSAEVRVRD